MNPIINQMMSSMFSNNPIMQMYKAVIGSNNKNQMMQSMAQQNPQLQQTLSFINQNGGNAKQLYYNMCQQKGIDPNIIINNMNNMK